MKRPQRSIYRRKLITAGYLLQNGACYDQVSAFLQLHNDNGARITLKGLRYAAENDLEITWLVDCLPYDLSLQYHEEVTEALRALDDAYDAASKAYEEAVKPIDHIWQKTTGGASLTKRKAALEEYKKACRIHQKAYADAIAEAEQAYEDAAVLALWNAIPKTSLPIEEE